LLDHMPTIADKLQKENWVLGSSGEQSAVKQQYDSIMPDILDLYGKEFLAAWNVALSSLQLRPLVADKPKYLALTAASSPTSPIKQIFESVRNETSLTKERKAPPSAANSETTKAAENLALQRASPILGSTGSQAVAIAMKSQRKAGDAPAEVPGASIEANFKPFQVLFEGEPPGRPIDALVNNLGELDRDLLLAAENPSQAKQALSQVALQVASLRSNVSRLPQPLSGMMQNVANDIDGDATNTSITELSQALAEQVTGTCLQIVNNRYPFAKTDKDVPMADFGRLFAPNGVLDKFFSTNLASLVNQSGKTWTWLPNPHLTKRLSDATLRQFQQAAEIRDTFFATGGAQPGINLEVKALTLGTDATTATLQINGSTVTAQQGTNAPAQVQWPGAGAAQASITMAPDMPDRKSSLERNGPWSFFRLIDAGSMTPHGNAVSVSFVVSGREVSFQFTGSSLQNPLSMSSLRQFKCPNGL
jgi:type VI secretion system protein ImpL